MVKMEFGEDAEEAVPSEELGLAARLSKKTQPKEKGEEEQLTDETCMHRLVTLCLRHDNRLTQEMCSHELR